MPQLRRLVAFIAAGVFVTVFMFGFRLLPSATICSNDQLLQIETDTRVSADASFKRHVETCVEDRLAVIKRQLPPDECHRFKDRPYLQRCSFTYATKCPDNTWLEEYFADLHRKRAARARAHDFDHPQAHFVGIFVGCNKGMDAVNAMRMGSGDVRFDKNQWVGAMTKNGSMKIGHAVCQQTTKEQFKIPDVRKDTSSSHSLRRNSRSSRPRLHCIEPMPATAEALFRSSRELGWDVKGFKVTHAAVAKKDGSARFPKAGEVGVENKGIANCASNPQDCVEVPVYSLESYVEIYLSDIVDDPFGTIHYLSVDVEGFDFDVLLGAQEKILPKVNYLEFEYNWMGSWATQRLEDAINMLDDLGFTCYWPGDSGNIWRITKCWLDHYSIRSWSNVACVNRNRKEVQSLASKMEDMFVLTVSKSDSIAITRHNR
eukprot:TRINITY_DN26307_c0_g1_i1.p1 TRINITY_DN26307_c0_g1~~TRINITY_DN26307_c0_g1_i1.p1  ORF type:complete len:430 (+),score=27.78 TRINITY_DN26307_c0_g1_i1:64-1353(+)